MNIIETFGKYVEQLSEDKPETARKLLKTGWQAQNLRFKYIPDKRLMPADQYLAQFMMDMLTFKYLADMYDVPSFFIDVPLDVSEASVDYVAKQLKELCLFLEKLTGNKIDEEKLKERIRCGQRTKENYASAQRERANRFVSTDLTTPLYGAITNNVLLGTKEQERYSQMLLEGIKNAEEKKGLHLYWMHTIPFWSEALRKQLYFSERAQIVGCELAQTFDGEVDPEKPYDAMARRLVYHCMNGSGDRRIENGIRCAKETGADGVIWFNHWGCKRTLGIARLAKKQFDEAGIPLLILDNDGCDRSHGGEGQMATRLEAFLEMLEDERNE